jgi:hypothetical protein
VRRRQGGARAIAAAGRAHEPVRLSSSAVPPPSGLRSR